MVERRRRFVALIIAALIALGGASYNAIKNNQGDTSPTPINTQNKSQLALQVLEDLAIKGRASKTGYAREQFGAGWGDLGACDVRNYILKRDMTRVVVRSANDCTVISGFLDDPYTGKIIQFQRGTETSEAVQIDHVVALSDAWQKGAQSMAEDRRAEFYNDPLNLLAVDGKANIQKGDGDAATWIPPNKTYRCRYVARQIAVKLDYKLWITQAEHDAMKRILNSCPNQVLPAA